VGPVRIVWLVSHIPRAKIRQAAPTGMSGARRPRLDADGKPVDPIPGEDEGEADPAQDDPR